MMKRRLLSSVKWIVAAAVLIVLCAAGFKAVSPYLGAKPIQISASHMINMKAKPLYGDKREGHRGQLRLDKVPQKLNNHNDHGGFHFGRNMKGMWLIPTLIQVLFIIAGWILLRKKSGSSVRQWTGAILILAGVLALLPAIIGIPVAILFGYGFYKIQKNKSGSAPMAMEPIYDISSPSMPASDFLDKWEQQINKEEK